VKPSHVWKLLKWVNNISEQNKKGLRVLKTIIEIRGNKRFKQMGQFSNSEAQFEDDIFTMNVKKEFNPSKAKDAFRKMT